MDDFKKITYGVIVGFILMLVVWVSFLFVNACGADFSCKKGAQIPAKTSIPSLIPATLPAPTQYVMSEATATQPPATTGESSGVPRPSNPGEPGEAVNLTGDPTAGAQVFASNCVSCHGDKGTGGVSNPGSTHGTVPTLNPIDPALVDADYKTFATNLDLFLQHGSTPAGTSPVFRMPAWGDSNGLTQQQIADVISYVISLNPASETASAPTATATQPPAVTGGGPEIARPSNPGGPGEAINLTGDPTAGAQVFASNCVPCHGDKGTGGVANPGSADGTVPPLNPIDSTLVDSDPKTYATNLDLFLQHGSTPEGTSPVFKMPAWGDSNGLTQQQIADVISYLISLNPASTAPQTAYDIARPSNPGGPGDAVNLTGDATSGAQLFAANCVPCHGDKGTGGVSNPGSTDGTVPSLNPIDPTIKDPDHKIFAYNIDLFIQHGSTPEGVSPVFRMPPWGDSNSLTQQQIADIIAYLISLNP